MYMADVCQQVSETGGLFKNRGFDKMKTKDEQVVALELLREVF